MKKTPQDVLSTMYQQFILKVDDAATIILKGHLLVEELLLDLLAARVFKHRDSVEKADLKFAQKLQLCRAWAPHPKIAPLWDLIAKLNVLRNDLGHSLTAPKRKPLMADIRHLYGQFTAPSPDIRMTQANTDEQVLFATFALVAGVLLALVDPGQAPPVLKAFSAKLHEE